jgi:hypothetical protein
MAVGAVHTKFLDEDFVDDKSLTLMLGGLRLLRTHITTSELPAELKAG